MDKNCLFCRIAAGEIPGKVVYEDEVCMAFMDLSQTTDGHTLVVPKSHYTNFLDVDPEVLKHMSVVAQNVANRICDKLGASGCNILSNANGVAGQTVMHFHIHIIPRYDDKDGLKVAFTDRSEVVSLDDIYKKIMA